MAALGLLAVAGCGGGGGANTSQAGSGGVPLTRLPGAHYSLTVIPPFPGDQAAHVIGMNNRGQVIGWSSLLAGADLYPWPWHPFLVSNGVQIPLARLSTDSGIESVRPLAINDNGLIVGLDGFTPILWRNGIPAPMSGLNQDYVPVAINNANVVLGISSQGYFLWDNGIVTLLPHNFGAANALNDAGVVAGSVLTDGQNFVLLPSGARASAPGTVDQPIAPNLAAAALLQNGITTLLPRLPASASLYVYAQAINNVGQVLGSVHTIQGQNQSVLWQNGQAIDLNTLLGATFSDAVSINDSGQILGSRDASAGGPTVFVYQNGAITDVNTLIPQGSTRRIDNPLHINNRGDILGYDAHQGTLVPVLLSPNEFKEPVVK